MIATNLIEKTVQRAKQNLVDEFETKLRNESDRIIKEQVDVFTKGLVSVLRSIDDGSLAIHIRFDEPET